MSNTEIVLLVSTLSTVAVALINTIGSVLQLWIRARYNYPPAPADSKDSNVIRDVPTTGASK